MDNLLSPSSCFLPPSPSSQYSTVGTQVIEFVPLLHEQWLFDDGTMSQNEDRELWAPMGSTLPRSPELSELPSGVPATPLSNGKRRGRKPGPRSDSRQTVGHVQAERQRRDKLNRRFCDLRAVVPNVSRMDKASLLADAATYIGELRTRVAHLEDEANKTLEKGAAAAASRGGPASKFLQVDETVDVRMVGRDGAAVRVTTTANHAPAQLMGALRSLELQVQHACVSHVQGVTLQDVLVDMPASMQDADDLRSALLQALQEQQDSA
ncbi:hypothetical protein CFC21_013487 [Triticum aestivum]|uniref:Transcription factor n=4 Tax=Triticinae TaxID=1648030 RepID=A0A9R1DTI8_WHEAT|nr:transcription factor MYC2-like [Aegilops tauschii subsp. strangulata]XP_044446043.1 transcription factor MYC2-like [Triticum aestivum]KAF6997242.1 hypothetical protein CFC21_013487 [Triticum aestivum]